MSSAEAPNSIASAASAIIVPASGPMMWTPSTRSVAASASTLTKPSVSAFVRARAFAVNGNLPTRYSIPAAFSSSSVLPTAGDLGPRVDDAGDRVVLDLRLLPGEALDDGDPLLLGLVRQHRAADHVADRVDAGDVGREILVDLDPPGAVARDADLVEAEPVGERPPADRHQHDIGGEGFALAAGGRLQLQRHGLVAGLAADDPGRRA